MSWKVYVPRIMQVNAYWLFGNFFVNLITIQPFNLETKWKHTKKFNTAKTQNTFLDIAQWTKSPKKKTAGRSAFCTQNTVPYCQIYTSTYCFFGVSQNISGILCTQHLGLSWYQAVRVVFDYIQYIRKRWKVIGLEDLEYTPYRN